MKAPAALLALLLAAPSFAQNQADKVSDLEKKLDTLSREVEALKLGSGASAGKPELMKSLSLNGYGHFDVQSFSGKNQKADPSSTRKTADLGRFVLGGEYEFSERIRMAFELEFEHGGTGEGGETRGEAAVEQAYLDFKLAEPVSVRAGHVIVPMGLVNLWHEPPVFHGVLRPAVEQVIIPSTWHENGAGFAGRWKALDYQTYVLAGMNAAKNADPSVDGFTGSRAIRGGRAEGSNGAIENLAWVGRLDFRPVEGVLVGGSLYNGRAEQQVTSQIPVNLWEGHLSADWRGAELRALYAQGHIGNADVVNATQLVQDPTFTDFVGSRFFGGYVQGAFNVLSLCSKTSQYAAPFFRYERYDTAARTPDQFGGNPATSRVDYVLGATYKPIPKVAIKTDYMWRRNGARTGVNQWNIGLGFMF
jgi:hypothetical protein